MMRELRAPFGGWKESGIGADGGRACEDFYTRQKAVTIPRRPITLRKLGA
jgi:acyl-CoA reductase-like NAD-dependent aldehyde dehydrogenase